MSIDYDKNAKYAGSDTSSPTSGRRPHGEMDSLQGRPIPVIIKTYDSLTHLVTCTDLRGKDMLPNKPVAKAGEEGGKMLTSPAQFRLVMDDELIKLIGSPEGKHGILAWGAVWPTSNVKENIIISEDRYISEKKGVTSSISAV